MARSWDFWDTLVTRCVLEPAKVFEIVEQMTGVAGFATARKAAEAESRAGVPETTLDRIYEFLPYDIADKQRLRKAELYVEEQLASPIMANVAQWMPGDVVVSDTYLDRETMLRIAAACGIKLPPENLYLSSELGATKHTGKLFDHVQRNIHLSIHVGDNRHSDVIVPARKGTSAKHFKEAPATPTERAWARSGFANADVIAGLLRAARLAEPPDSGYRAGEWVLYSQLVAPFLLRFVDWTLRQCEQRGIEHLFFMARDGQVLYRIACSLLTARRSKIQAHYLYGSRHAFHLPGHVSMKQSASWILENTALLTLRVIAERIGADVGSVAAIAARYFAADIDENLSEIQRRHLSSLIGDADFADLVRASSERSFESAFGYLRQIGLLDPAHQRVGIVDVGWVGRVQRSLEAISAKAGIAPERIHGFYLGLSSKSEHVSGERLVGMLADPFRSDLASGEPWIDSYRGVIEFFLRANHPTTLGYKMDSRGLYVPILGAQLSDSEKREIERKQDAIMAFVDRYCRLEPLIGKNLADALRPAEWHMRRLLEKPTCEEAAVFAGHSLSEQQVETDFTPIVRPINITDLFKRGMHYRFGIWPEGSYALSAVPWLFRLRRWPRRVAGSVYRRLKRSFA